MYTFLARRLLATIPVLLIVAVLVFLMLRLTPGDPAAILAGDAANTEQIERIRESLGLNRPILVQFGIWFGNLLSGDLGESFYYKQKVTALIAQRLEPTISLAALTTLFAVLVSVPLGVLAAWRFGGWFDRALMGFATRSKLDGLVSVASARRPPYRLTERILRLSRNPHATFAVRPARVLRPRARAPQRAMPAGTGAARWGPSSIGPRRCVTARAAVAPTGRAAVAAISSSASQHGVQLLHRAGTARA